jgi:hypothetical protein
MASPLLARFTPLILLLAPSEMVGYLLVLPIKGKRSRTMPWGMGM